MCTACLATHIGETSIRTAQGLSLAVRDRIPRTPHDGIAAAYALLMAQDEEVSAFDERGLPEGGPPYSQDDLRLGAFIVDIWKARPNILFGMNAKAQGRDSRWHGYWSRPSPKLRNACPNLRGSTSTLTILPRRHRSATAQVS